METISSWNQEDIEVLKKEHRETPVCHIRKRRRLTERIQLIRSLILALRADQVSIANHDWHTISKETARILAETTNLQNPFHRTMLSTMTTRSFDGKEVIRVHKL